MIPARLLRQPLTVQAMAVQPDGYGNQVLQPDGDPVALKGYLDFGDSSEGLTDRDVVTSHWTAYLPAGTELSAYDRIGFGGQTFQVEGAPQQVWNPRRGLVNHVEVRLTAVV